MPFCCALMLVGAQSANKRTQQNSILPCCRSVKRQHNAHHAPTWDDSIWSNCCSLCWRSRHATTRWVSYCYAGGGTTHQHYRTTLCYSIVLSPGTRHTNSNSLNAILSCSHVGVWCPASMIKCYFDVPNRKTIRLNAILLCPYAGRGTKRQQEDTTK